MRTSMKRITNPLFVFMAIAFLLSTTSLVNAQTSRERNTRKAREAAAQSDKAARIFSQIMATREKSIPHDLLDRAEAVAVFPSGWKGGFIVGGCGGSGGFTRPGADGWGWPAFFELAGGTVAVHI